MFSSWLLFCSLICEMWYIFADKISFTLCVAHLMQFRVVISLSEAYSIAKWSLLKKIINGNPKEDSFMSKNRQCDLWVRLYELRRSKCFIVSYFKYISFHKMYLYDEASIRCVLLSITQLRIDFSLLFIWFML